MNKVYFLFLLLFFHLSLKAQHCQYCNSALIALYPSGHYNNKLIDGLKITIVDKNGNPRMHDVAVYNKRGKYLKSLPDTARFWQNNSRSARLTIEGARSNDTFSFAGNHYIFITGRSLPVNCDTTLFIKIEDVDDSLNGGKYETVIIPFCNVYRKLLCGYGSAHYDLNTNATLNVLLTLVGDKRETPTTSFSKKMRYTIEYNVPFNGPETLHDNGHFANLFKVYEQFRDTVVYESHVWGNRNMYRTIGRQDLPELRDFDFDGYYDFRVPAQAYAGKHNYFIYDTSLNSFVEDKLLNSLSDVTIDSSAKHLRGVVIETGNTHYDVYDLVGSQHNFVIMTSLFYDGSIRPESVHCFHKIKGELVPQADSALKELKTLTEVDDYNFDGHSDFRLRNTTDTTKHYYYLYDVVAKNYLLDTFMSNMQYISIDKTNKQINGSVLERTFLTSKKSDYLFSNGKFEEIRRVETSRPSLMSEQVDVTIYKRKDGKLQIVDHGRIQ